MAPRVENDWDFVSQVLDKNIVFLHNSLAKCLYNIKKYEERTEKLNELVKVLTNSLQYYQAIQNSLQTLHSCSNDGCKTKQVVDESESPPMAFPPPSDIIQNDDQTMTDLRRLFPSSSSSSSFALCGHHDDKYDGSITQNDQTKLVETSKNPTAFLPPSDIQNGDEDTIVTRGDRKEARNLFHCVFSAGDDEKGKGVMKKGTKRKAKITNEAAAGDGKSLITANNNKEERLYYDKGKPKSSYDSFIKNKNLLCYSSEEERRSAEERTSCGCQYIPVAKTLKREQTLVSGSEEETGETALFILDNVNREKPTAAIARKTSKTREESSSCYCAEQYNKTTSSEPNKDSYYYCADQILSEPSSNNNSFLVDRQQHADGRDDDKRLILREQANDDVVAYEENQNQLSIIDDKLTKLNKDDYDGTSRKSALNNSALINNQKSNQVVPTTLIAEGYCLSTRSVENNCTLNTHEDYCDSSSNIMSVNVISFRRSKASSSSSSSTKKSKQPKQMLIGGSISPRSECMPTINEAAESEINHKQQTNSNNKLGHLYCDLCSTNKQQNQQTKNSGYAAMNIDEDEVFSKTYLTCSCPNNNNSSSDMEGIQSILECVERKDSPRDIQNSNPRGKQTPNRANVNISNTCTTTTTMKAKNFDGNNTTSSHDNNNNAYSSSSNNFKQLNCAKRYPDPMVQVQYKKKWNGFTIKNK